jgi:hypothetical protein
MGTEKIEFSEIQDPNSWSLGKDVGCWSLDARGMVRIPVQDLKDSPDLLPGVWALIKDSEAMPTDLLLPFDFFAALNKGSP